MVNIFGIKGGVGATTVAAALTVLTEGTLISDDADPVLNASTGIATVTLGDGPTFHDSGILGVYQTPPDGSIVVVTNCYLALRKAVAANLAGCQVVAIIEPGRALDAKDVTDVLGTRVVAIPRDPTISRCVDAGLLTTRLPRVLADPLLGAIEAQEAREAADA